VGDRLSLIGTIHVDPKSASFARETILRLKPEVVALELDEGRLMRFRIRTERLAARRRVFPGYDAFGEIRWRDDRFASGTRDDRAVEAARAVGARVAFVDLPIGMTVGSLRKLPLREKVRLGVDSVVSIALLPFGGFNLSKLTENLEEQLRLFRLRYPELSRLLLMSGRSSWWRGSDIMYSTAGPVVAVVGLDT